MISIEDLQSDSSSGNETLRTPNTRRNYASLLTLVIIALQVLSVDALRVVVFGATGKTGRLVVEKYLSESISDKSMNVSVVAAVRDLSRGRKMLGKESNVLQVVPCDLVTASSRKITDIVRGADAVICAAADPLGAMKVDSIGTKKLIDACIDCGVPKFVLLSSLLTNGFAAGQLFNPQYLLLNAIGGVLLIKRSTEVYLQGCRGINYSIVRPGGLSDKPSQFNVLLGSADTLFGGSISRQQVAEVLVECVRSKESRNKIVEIIASPNAISQPYDQLFKGLKS